MVQLSTAFAGQALPVSTRASQTARVVPRCSVAEVEKYFPAYRRNKAPVISFNGEEGIKLQMTRIKAFQEVDNDTPPLLDYSDPEQFAPVKPVPPSAISWPGGDGRGRTMTGTKGSFTQADLKTYGPFPDFFKVRICSFLDEDLILTVFGSLEILRYVMRRLRARVSIFRASKYFLPRQFGTVLSIKSRFYCVIRMASFYPSLSSHLVVTVLVCNTTMYVLYYIIQHHGNHMFRFQWKILKFQ